MREILFRGKRIDTGEWIEGYIYRVSEKFRTTFLMVKDMHACSYEVDPETVGQYTGLTDKDDKRIFEGDIVDFFGRRGRVVFECGVFGIGFWSDIDYDTMQQRIYDLTGTMNTLNCCFNDNFISLWEIFWNFNCEEDCCHVLEVIGNIHDNPELIGEHKDTKGE